MCGLLNIQTHLEHRKAIDLAYQARGWDGVLDILHPVLVKSSESHDTVAACGALLESAQAVGMRTSIIDRLSQKLSSLAQSATDPSVRQHALGLMLDKGLGEHANAGGARLNFMVAVLADAAGRDLVAARMRAGRMSAEQVAGWIVADFSGVGAGLHSACTLPMAVSDDQQQTFAKREDIRKSFRDLVLSLRMARSESSAAQAVGLAWPALAQAAVESEWIQLSLRLSSARDTTMGWGIDSEQTKRSLLILDSLHNHLTDNDDRQLADAVKNVDPNDIPCSLRARIDRRELRTNVGLTADRPTASKKM